MDYYEFEYQCGCRIISESLEELPPQCSNHKPSGFGFYGKIRRWKGDPVLAHCECDNSFIILKKTACNHRLGMTFIGGIPKKLAEDYTDVYASKLCPFCKKTLEPYNYTSTTHSGKRLKKWQKELGLSCRELADKVHVQLKTIYGYRLGGRPGPEVLDRFQKVFGISEELFHD